MNMGRQGYGNMGMGNMNMGGMSMGRQGMGNMNMGGMNMGGMNMGNMGMGMSNNMGMNNQSNLMEQTALNDKNIIQSFQNIMQNFEISEPKTKLMVKSLASLKVEGKVLIIADTKAAEKKYLELAARNIPSVKTILPSNLNVKDLLEADFVIMTEAAVNDVTERLN